MFFLPPSRPRRRPAELIYAADEVPPPASLLLLAFQHAAMVLALLTYVLIAANQGGLSGAAAGGVISGTILAMAIASILQAVGGRIGSGALILFMPSPVMITVVAVTLAQTGAPGLFLVGLVSGLTQILLAGVLPRLRPLFPPTVAGVAVVMIGVSLIASAVGHFFGVTETVAVDGPGLAVASLTLALIVGLSVWAPRGWKLMALLIGIAAGIGLAGLLGRIEGLDGLAGVPWAALPAPVIPRLAFNPGIIASVVVLALMTCLDMLATVVIMDKMDDAEWRRGDMKMIGAAIRGGGLSDIASGILGGMPVTNSSANLGLCHASAATARLIGLAAGILIAIVAFLPKVTLAITLMPLPVMGAVEMYTSAFLITAGVELIASRAVDSRGIFMIGVSVTLGTGVLLVPQLVHAAPAWAAPMVENCVVVGGGAAVLLNLLFRLGTRRRVTQSFETAPAVRELSDFVEQQGAAWSARRDVVQRAAMAATEAAEMIQAAGEGRRITGVTAAFDEFNFDVWISHGGPPLTLGAATPLDLATALGDDDDALEAAMAAVSTTLIRHLADRVRPSAHDGAAVLWLHFDH